MLCLHPDLWLARDSGTLRLQAVAAQSSTTAAKRLRRRLPSEGLLTPQTQQQTAERRRPSDADQALLGQDLSLQVHSQLRASPAFFSAPLLSAETLHRKPCYQPLPPVAVPAGAAAASSSSSSFCSSPPKTASAAELAAGRRRVVAGDEGGSAAPEPVSSSVFDAESSHGDARVQGEASTASWSLPMLSPGLSAAQLPCKRKGNAAECLGRRHVLSCPEIDGVLREPDDDDDLHGTEAAAAVSSPKRETSVAVLVGGATPECAAAVSSVSAGGEGALLDDDASDAPPWICAVNAAPLQIQGERAIRSSPAAIRPLRTAERQSPPAPSARPEGVLTEAFIPSTSSLAAPDSLLAAETLFDHGSAEAFSVESFSSPRGAEDLHSSVTAADAASSLAAAAALGDSDSSCADEVSAAEDSAAASSLMDALSPAQTEGGDGAQETSAAASSSRAGGVAGGSLLLQLPPRMLNPVERAASAAVLQAPAAGHSAAAPRRLFGCWPSSSPEASLASCAQAAAAAAAAASSSTASKSSLRILKSGAGGGDSTSTSSGRSSTCAGSSSCGSATSAGRRRSAGKAAVAAAFCRGCAVALVESEAAAAKQQQAPALLSTIALGGSGRVCCACGGRVAAAALSGDAATHSQQQSLAAPPRKDLPPSSGPFQSTTGGGVVVGAAAAVVGAGGGVSAAAGSSSSPSCSFAENAAAVDAAAALASFSFLASPKGIAQQQPQQQPHLQNAAAAAAAAPGPGSRCCSRQTRHTRQSSGFSTSAATATAAGAGASPSSTRAPALRLPIPTRALRRLQKPRAMTQQQLCEGGQEGAARAARRGLVVRPPPLAEDAAAGEGSGSLRWGAQNPSAAVAAGETSAGGVVLNCPCVGGECLSGLHHHTPRHHPLHATPNRTPSASPSLHATPHLQRFRGPSSPSTASFPQSSSNATTTATPVSFGGFFDGDRLGPPSEETRRGGLRPVQQRETHAPAFWIAEDAAGAAEATAVLAAAEDPFHAAAHAAQEAAFAAARAAACAAAHAQELQRRASNTHPQQEPQPPALNKNSAGGGADALSASPEAGDEESLACPGNLGGSGSSAGGCICSRLDLTATTLDGDNLPPPFFCLERQPPRVSVYPDLQRSIRDDFELRFPAGPALAGASLQATAATPAGSASQQQRSAGAGDGVGGTSSMDSAIKNSATTSGVETPTSVAVASTTAAAVSVAGGLCDASNQILIGEGRYGRVILGQHRKTRALVAVKVIEKRRVSDAEGWDCCRQELEIHRCGDTREVCCKVREKERLRLRLSRVVSGLADDCRAIPTSWKCWMHTRIARTSTLCKSSATELRWWTWC